MTTEAILKEAQAKISEIEGMPVYLYYKTRNVDRLESLKDVVSEEIGIEPKDIFEKRRFRKFVIARQLFNYFANVHYGYRVTYLSEVFKCHHTSIIHGRDTIVDLLSVKDCDISIMVDHIKSRLNIAA